LRKYAYLTVGLDANRLFNAISWRRASKLRRAIGTSEIRTDISLHECDAGARPNDQDATLLVQCKELAGSAPRVVTSMRSLATDRVHVFGPTRDVTE
jgi:hypothetical protein